ncbi:hypothetical protein A3C20_04740 [Candidatus Kaiserbacteria bacterium RIFCSPHIGHO2_02_FULL_55_25]|uniref:Uncharacterized protein n=1 Tax=Candidatus Kaiserbacteria bacterium RIFCSPHIGHO2_02_FULL_55_25 TaxID=1798498 RepID=A0A1F6EB09_9BACT|nr:MAG: hypothetical protein A2764_02225 [Candidatus Kaiserbacteria bacterium RIFCSPHIGHO2_01_FULL_55_79]OGG70797.1 MAG: hypothetical protein A3C20_04740 [Candidatus Kaiserbacteria bacterium RIFCSPHIGHO2_02_FULL_55_25]OGG77156.1 MAG: hypothetical protein A3F56_04800 [Candidatus Kaiserbacteria bacterium RIFCSPHIGHO2_12_FULL_55_13]OGG83410.1 MAG: hypothetical protein A3A42_04325 [Candidatus Kaiserbacteria bacterium RIFCSPLOWO2_01_FULL_55_25]
MNASTPLAIGLILVVAVGGLVYMQTRNPHPLPTNPQMVPTDAQEDTTLPADSTATTTPPVVQVDAIVQ